MAEEEEKGGNGLETAGELAHRDAPAPDRDEVVLGEIAETRREVEELREEVRELREEVREESRPEPSESGEDGLETGPEP